MMLWRRFDALSHHKFRKQENGAIYVFCDPAYLFSQTDMLGNRLMATWMLVEDELDLYEMLLAMIELMGKEGVAFSTGTDALKWIDMVDHGTVHGELPELALIDIRMPGGISGLDVSRHLRNSLFMSYTKIVLMTAYKMSALEVKDAIRQSGADLLLYKPLPRLDQLKDILDSVIYQP
jgi:CheY-like chemotaxis protein